MQRRRIFAFSFALLVTFAPLRRVKNDASVKPRARARARRKQKRDRANNKTRVAMSEYAAGKKNTDNHQERPTRVKQRLLFESAGPKS